MNNTNIESCQNVKRGSTSSKCDENDNREWTRREVEKPLQKSKKSLKCYQNLNQNTLLIPREILWVTVAKEQ